MKEKPTAQEWRMSPTGFIARIDGQWYSVNGTPSIGVSDVRFPVDPPEPMPGCLAEAPSGKYKVKVRAAAKPSLRTLTTAFGESKAPSLRRILEARRREEILSLSSDAEALQRESYGRHSAQTLRFAALSQALGGFGEESFRTRKGERVTYVNMGDPYVFTILKFRGVYRVGDWGTLVEKHGSEF